MSSIRLRAPITLVALALTLTACVPPRLTSNDPVAAPAVAAHAFVREELYFGVKRRAGGEVTEADWARFLEEVVTPQFPEGLTVLQGQGQYRLADSTIVKESTRLILVLYESTPAIATAKRAAIFEITRRYKERFDQESVLRVTSMVQAAF